MKVGSDMSDLEIVFFRRDGRGAFAITGDAGINFLGPGKSPDDAGKKNPVEGAPGEACEKRVGDVVLLLKVGDEICESGGVELAE